MAIGPAIQRNHHNCWYWAGTMKTLRNLVLIMLAVVAVLILSTQLLRAQSLELRSLTSDRGWHGVGGNVQVHQPTLEFSPPWVGVWERSARSNRYGDWMYVKVLINCQQWSQVAFATLDDDWNMVLISDLTGRDPQSHWPEADTEPYRTMTSVCALYGYARTKQAWKPTPVGDFVER